MKLFVIGMAVLALSACANFPASTKVAPGFPDDHFELSHNMKVPGSHQQATLGQLGR